MIYIVQVLNKYFRKKLTRRTWLTCHARRVLKLKAKNHPEYNSSFFIHVDRNREIICLGQCEWGDLKFLILTLPLEKQGSQIFKNSVGDKLGGHQCWNTSDICPGFQSQGESLSHVLYCR